MTLAQDKRPAEDKRLEWFAWSPGDFYAMVSHLPKATQHAYRDLLDHAFLHGRDQTDLPDDDELLQEVVGQTADEWTRTRRRLFTGPRPMFEATGDGFLRNRRLSEEVAKAREKSDKARRSAKAKWRPDSEVETHHEDEAVEGREVEEADAFALRSLCERNATHSSSSSFSVSDSGVDSLLSQNQRKPGSRARGGRSAAAAHPIPDDWRPDAALFARMRTLYPDFDLDADLGEFRAFWERRASSPKGKKSDWGLTWMRDLAAKREKRPKGTPRPDPKRFNEFDDMRTFE
jgi:uncharacterized protein YdaU (DUF1376 family)